MLCGSIHIGPYIIHVSFSVNANLSIVQVVVNQGDNTRPNAFLNAPFISVDIYLTNETPNVLTICLSNGK